MKKQSLLLPKASLLLLLSHVHRWPQSLQIWELKTPLVNTRKMTTRIRLIDKLHRKVSKTLTHQGQREALNHTNLVRRNNHPLRQNRTVQELLYVKKIPPFTERNTHKRRRRTSEEEAFWRWTWIRSCKWQGGHWNKTESVFRHLSAASEPHTKRNIQNTNINTFEESLNSAHAEPDHKLENKTRQYSDEQVDCSAAEEDKSEDEGKTNEKNKEQSSPKGEEPQWG